jgi:superfamily II DNA or RNA helicase
MCQPAIYGDVFTYYQKLGEGRQAIAYCVSVKHSQQVADMFNAQGVKAVSIDGGMSLKERDIRMELFRSGKVQILCNCNLISEGVTLPNASVALLLRPTCSLPLFIQQSCRVLTPFEGKKAVIIDYVNNVQKHGLPTDDHEWSLGEQVKKRKQYNDDGTLRIRQCSECFKCFKTAPKCPWCGKEYEVKGRELKQIQDVELKKIEELKLLEEEQRSFSKVKMRFSKQQQCYQRMSIWQMSKLLLLVTGVMLIQLILKLLILLKKCFSQLVRCKYYVISINMLFFFHTSMAKGV